MKVRNSYIGQPIERTEDLRFLRGRGTYVADVEPARPALCGDFAQLGCARPDQCNRHLAAHCCCPASVMS